MRIAVHGASGFTGRLTVAEVRRRGFTPVLAGRDEARLRKVAAEVGAAAAEVRVAALDDGDALADVLRDCEVVVNCAGPFAALGAPVIRAAIAAGVPYVDTTGEQRYIRRVLEEFGAAAARAGVAVVPGMADDGGPGDMIARLVADRLGADPAQMVIADLRSSEGAASRGTVRTMAAVFAEGPVEYADGAWYRVTDPAQRPPLVIRHAEEEVPVSAFALPGLATIPRHVRAGRVRSVIRTEVADLIASFSEDLIDSVPEVPDEEDRRADRWLMLAEATAPDGRRARGRVTGADAYGATAVIATEAARRLAAGGAPAGVLAPAQAFDAADFLGHLAAAHDVDWHVDAVM
ncbi:saccharopine dehydrogenase NADP-binding domain-containing protein [Nonomuraea sp. SBT364]|uniref:saccharopine dehydrogenase NADP-binding domain-containing protein n=1 Tax=Nonomuraea sp. SBT364 TaxID=1580530 RepID=UPI00066C651F|nr:saccharopine dehydrogenase NADP-binding domain-containing protein [Nonomuraea sp. SBT364]